MHEKSINYYDKLAKHIINPMEIRNKSQDSSDLDLNYLIKFLDKKSTILDLGSGTGLLVNKLCAEGFNIHAVERYKEFAKFIELNENVVVNITDIRNYKPIINFKYITAFGVLNFFRLEDAFDLYKKIYAWIKPDGIFILKHQMGIVEDVLIDGYSDELGVEYFSNYRSLATEINLLTKAGFIIRRVDDIYGNQINRWKNTHFYAIVASRLK